MGLCVYVCIYIYIYIYIYPNIYPKHYAWGLSWHPINVESRSWCNTLQTRANKKLLQMRRVCFDAGMLVRGLGFVCLKTCCSFMLKSENMVCPLLSAPPHMCLRFVDCWSFGKTKTHKSFKQLFLICDFTVPNMVLVIFIKIPLFPDFCAYCC
jgi:hypothetical protein